jgi:mono/diheme cytochrome c family protein
MLRPVEPLRAPDRRRTARARLVTAVRAAAAVGAAAPRPAAPATPEARLGSPLDPAAARGRTFAERRCAGCHNVGADDGPPDEGPPFRRLVGRYDAASLSQRFAQVSAHGMDRMPPITFTSGEREDLLAYVRTLRGE